MLKLFQELLSLWKREKLTAAFQHATRNKQENLIFPLNDSYTALKTYNQQDMASKIPFIESKEQVGILIVLWPNTSIISFHIGYDKRFALESPDFFKFIS